MRILLLFLVVAALAVGAVVYFHEPEPEKPDKPTPDRLGGRTRTVNPGGIGPGGLPGLPGGGPPRFNPMQSTEVMAEFTEEMGLTESEAKDFFAALKKSEQSLFQLSQIDKKTGLPSMPSREKLEAAVKERERILTDELGEDGYQKFKSFSTTLPMRMVINRLDGGLTAEQKKSVLSDAYADIDTGSVPGSPQEFSKALSDAVLKHSAVFLSEKDQTRLAEAVKGEVSSMLGGFPGGTPPDLPPGAPPMIPERIVPPPGGLPGGLPSGLPPIRPPAPK